MDVAVGAIGPEGPSGEPGLTWMGQWDAGTTYVEDDAVNFNGSSYVSLSENTGQQPDISPGIWDVLAQKGDTGAEGPQGEQPEIDLRHGDWGV